MIYHSDGLKYTITINSVVVNYLNESLSFKNNYSTTSSKREDKEHESIEEYRRTDDSITLGKVLLFGVNQ